MRGVSRSRLTIPSLPALSVRAIKSVLTLIREPADIREFGRFDVPTLFGISKTAPYFHDNSAATLEQVIDHYQALFNFLKFLEPQGFFAPAVNGQGCNPGDCGFSPIPEPLIPGLLAYLKQI